MKLTRSNLLTVTPLILTAMAHGAAAQEAAGVGSLLIQNTQTVNADTSQGSSVVFPLQISIPADGTYVFSVPAISGIQLTIDGQALLSETATAGTEPVKAIVSMTAGTHAVEISGEGLTLADLADVTANVLGMPVASIVEISAPATTNQVASFSSTTSSPAAEQVASVEAVDTSVVESATTAASRTVTSTQTPAAATVSGLISLPRPGDNDRTEVGGILRTTIRDAVTVAIAGEPTSVGTAPVVGAGEAQSSPLSPPSGVALTQAVEIIGGATDDGVVASTGQTLFGGVMDPLTYDTVLVTIAPSNREVTVDVGPTTGQFAVRLFEEDLTTGGATVTVTGASSADANVVTAPVEYEYTSGAVVDGVSQALSRMTYGPTVDLYSRLRTIGFENYVNEQLNPGSIRDAAFDSMDVDQYVRNLTDNFTVFRRAEMAHRMSYAAYSDKQLQEVMGDFWSNHFFASTKDTRVYIQNSDDRQFYRDNAFGDFEDLLLYSARSPLMSQFLDNDQSRVGNINENYGREILELHTVGVDGGYGDDDVIAVSRAFTGWQFERTNPNEDTLVEEYDFIFDSSLHDAEDKVIPFLNTTIAGRSGANGVQEGEELIALLADDPRTHSYVCGKIVQRFVADDAPAEFVDICTTAWAATDGDAGEILRAILLAPEFLEGAADRGTKAKTPYEYSVSYIRLMGIEIEPSQGANFFDRFRDAAAAGGYAPLDFGLPTGLDEVGSTWVSSGSILGSYRGITEVAVRTNTYDIDIESIALDAGLETAEEVAAFFLTIATADIYTLEEYEALVEVLKGEDGIFEPLTSNETPAFEKAGGLLAVLPSFSLQ